MFIYMAAVHSNSYRNGGRWGKLSPGEQEKVMAVPHLLESYHYIQKEKYVNVIRELGDHVFLDSGAFSAYTLGVELSITAYCDYIKRNQDIILKDGAVLIASVMDGIGDAQLTYENQLEMESQGVQPLPCFHLGEDERYLEWYVANYEYITLGGMVGRSVPQLTLWLDRIWQKYLTDDEGTPLIKVHAFGITSITIMKKYPWWSCDSSSWIQSAAFGAVITPQFGPLQVSEKSPSRHVAGQHVSTLAHGEKAKVMELFKSQGFSFERLSTVYESRAAYNLWAFGQINIDMDKVAPSTFHSNTQELF